MKECCCDLSLVWSFFFMASPLRYRWTPAGFRGREEWGASLEAFWDRNCLDVVGLRALANGQGCWESGFGVDL